MSHPDYHRQHRTRKPHLKLQWHRPQPAAATTEKLVRISALARMSLPVQDSHAHGEQGCDAIATEVIGIRGRASGDIPTTVNVHLWRHLAINGYAVEQQLFKAYVRCQRVEKPGARDATHVDVFYC